MESNHEAALRHPRQMPEGLSEFPIPQETRSKAYVSYQPAPPSVNAMHPLSAPSAAHRRARGSPLPDPMPPLATVQIPTAVCSHWFPRPVGWGRTIP